MHDDAELLRRYVSENSQEAFAELVNQHVGLVYHTALRYLNGDAHSAEDVAQKVFADLARKARTLADRPLIAGWLHTGTRFAALEHRRAERRRTTREKEAHAMQEQNRDAHSAADWERLRPIIDDALHELDAKDREAVLLRFFEGRDFAGIGAQLQLSADGARSRVDRALDKLQGLLESRGLESTASLLATTLVAEVTPSAPAGLAGTITSGAMRRNFRSASAASVGAGALSFARIAGGLLALSIGANFVGGGFLLLSREVPAPNSPDVQTVVESTAVPVVTERKPEILTDPLEIGRRLKADGFSGRAILAGVRAFVLGDDAANKARASRVQRWNPSPQNSAAIPASLVPVSRGLDRTNTDRIASVLTQLGYDSQGIPFAAAERNLSPDKTAALRQIEEKYPDPRFVAIQRNPGAASISAQTIAGIENEYESAVLGVLTPDEAAEYFRRYSPTAKQVQKLLEGIEVSDSGYAAIVDKALEVDRLNRDGGITSAVSESRQAALVHTYRQQLGDEAFLVLSSRIPAGRAFAEADAIYQKAGLPPSIRADRYVAMIDAFAAIEDSAPGVKPTVAANAFIALTATLNEADAEAMRQTSVKRLLDLGSTRAAHPSP